MKLRQCVVTLGGIALIVGLLGGCPSDLTPPGDGTGDANGSANGDANGDGAQLDGSTLYSANCATCHGNDGTGAVGPDVTGDTAAGLTTGLESAIHGGISLTAEEIAAIAVFLGE